MSTRKNALEFALQKFANPEFKHEVLCTIHAVLSTAMVEAAVEKIDDAKKSAQMECFARSIKLVEDQLGTTFSAAIPMPRTAFVTKDQIPKA